ncbi:MAG: hypothetical protein M1371_11125 [Actinobacteria bacterium]|nr:hypothetical protein [Actinomycetota bacterium]
MIEGRSHESESIYQLFFDKALADLRELRDKIFSCNRCFSNTSGDVKKVIGSGFPIADIFLLKSDLTPDELEFGVSFYGRDGEVISKACSALENIKFEYIYGSACHKCHENNLDGVDLDCSDFISTELRIVRPRIILAMGSRAFSTLQDAGYTGKEQVYAPGELIRSNYESLILATYDISEALSSEEMKKAFWSHLKLLDRSYKRMLMLFEKDNPLK